MHRNLKQAVAAAVRWRMLLHSPVDSVDRPKVEGIKMKALDAGETAAPCPLPRQPHVRAGPTGSHVRAPARRNHGVALGLCRSCPRAVFGSGKHGTDSKGNPVKGDEKWPRSHRGYSLIGHRGASFRPRSPSRGVVETGRPAERPNLCCAQEDGSQTAQPKNLSASSAKQAPYPVSGSMSCGIPMQLISLPRGSSEGRARAPRAFDC
jgi:hypothetical protein